MREPVFYTEVFAVSGGVLPDKIDLANALRVQASRFADHGFRTPASIRATVLRDHAERARMVAAFRDLDVGVMLRRGKNARCQVVIQVRLERVRDRLFTLAERDDLVEFVGADQRVDFRQILLNVAAIAFHQAAGDDQLLCAMPVFLCSAISRMVSTDSCLAGSMKLQVLTTMTSASSGRGVSSWPLRASWPIMTSVSTRFFGQPRLTNPTFKLCIRG